MPNALVEITVILEMSDPAGQETPDTFAALAIPLVSVSASPFLVNSKIGSANVRSGSLGTSAGVSPPEG